MYLVKTVSNFKYVNYYMLNNIFFHVSQLKRYNFELNNITDKLQHFICNYYFEKGNSMAILLVNNYCQIYQFLFVRFSDFHTFQLIYYK